MSTFGLGPVVAQNISGNTEYYQQQVQFKEQVLDPVFLTINDFDNAMQDVETGTITLPTLDAYSRDKPAVNSVDLNGQSLVNMSTISLASGLSALASTAISVGSSILLHPNTSILNPLPTASYGDKQMIDLADADVIDPDTDTGEQILNKRHQGVNQGFMIDNAITQSIRKDEQGLPYGLYLGGKPFDCFRPNTLDQPEPRIIQGVADPIFDFDAVNKRSTIVEDEKQVEDPLTHNLYNRLQVGDRVLQLKDTLDPLIPPIPGTQYSTMISKQAITKSYADDKFHQKGKQIDFGSNKGVNCSNPTDSNDVVIKSYCDANSKNNDGTGALTGLLGGVLGGALSTALVSTIGQGLTTLGQISGSLAAGTAALSTGIKVGSEADFDRYQPGVGESQQLIDNVKSDIANGGSAVPGQNVPGGSLLNGAMTVSGLFRAVRNAQIGLFDLA